jgi:hypothetical protein
MGDNQSWPYFAEDEIAAVRDVLRSGRVNQWTGDRVAAFEQVAAQFFRVPHALAVSNGSVALEIALRALRIGPGDEVIVTSRSFVASASCVVLAGATPVFADVDPRSQNMTVETVAPLVTRKTRAILPVHLAGWPCNMPGIMDFAKTHDLLVIEDCAQAVGAKIAGRPVGSFGDAAAISFCQDKIVSTGGEGGMVLFHGKEAYERAWQFKDHGKNLDAKKPGTGPGFRWVHDDIGTNLRMTEMQAAIGLKQFEKLESWLVLRRRNAAIWRQAFSSNTCLRVPEPPEDVFHAFYKFYAFVEPDRLAHGQCRDKLLLSLKQAGIRAFSGICPEIYREKAFSRFSVESRPVARLLGETSLMFEVHPTLDPEVLQETAARASAIIAGAALA